MTLLIVESPTKARTLTKFLPDSYTVLATKGHIKDLPKSKLGVDVENHFAPTFDVVDRQKDTVKSISSAAKKAGLILLATDPDREGEAISAHVNEILSETKLKKDVEIKRIEFHEITKSALDEAIAHPRAVNTALVSAQTARRVLDRIVGYKLSPLLWKKVKIGLSAGRVQSVAVRLIVEREKEILAFNPVEYWEIIGKVSGEGVEQFELSLVSVDGARIVIGESEKKGVAISNHEKADTIINDLKSASFLVSAVNKKEVRKNPYPPFTTSTMTQAAARLFGYSAKRTMSLAQGLYEKGMITYHRTDSVNLAPVSREFAKKYIVGKFGPDYYPEQERYYKKQSKNAQEAHEAIRPTDLSAETPEGPEGKLYDLIKRRFLACLMSSAVYDATSIEVEAKGKKSYLLRTSGQTIKFPGWRALFPKDDGEVVLPAVEMGAKLNCDDILGTQKFTEPPARYNEASIIKTLESLGIGRPSTYAPTISTIIDRGYVEKEDNKFIPTPIGVAVSDFLTTNFDDVVNYGFTASMEDMLDAVSRGEADWAERMELFWSPFSKKLEEVEANAPRVKIQTVPVGRKCPKCETGELVIRQGRFGKFISCSTYPDCDYTEKIVNKIDMICPKCNQGDVVMKKTKKGRRFFGCSRYPECDFASWKKPTADQAD